MPRFEKRCGAYTLKVKDMDREPPRCHVSGPGFAHVEIGLYDRRLMSGTDRKIRSYALRECLRLHQSEMLKAWDEVIKLSGR